MTENNNSNYSTLTSSAKSITVKSFLAAILCLIIYMSVLLLYRGIAEPSLAGYTKTAIDKETNKTSFSTHYFEGAESSKIPQSDDYNTYSPIYNRDGFPEIFSQIISFIVLALMVYDAAWNYGSHQSNAVSFGRTKRDLLEGIKLGICGSLVGIIAYCVLLISEFGSGFSFALPLFSAVNAAYLPFLNFFLNFTDKPYDPSGLTVLTQGSTLEISALGIIMMLIPIILKVIICFIGYELGFRQISIKDKILYKNKSE